MEPQSLDPVRDALVERREQLQGQIDQMGDEQVALGEDQGLEMGALGNHMADDAGNLFEAQRLATISEDLRDSLVQVDAALERMDGGQFGTCQRCGNPIDPERLEALPHAAFCIDCQRLVEQGSPGAAVSEGPTAVQP